MTLPLTQIYADFAVSTMEKGVPAGAADVARLGFTDCAGVMLAGLKEPVVRVLRGVAGSIRSADGKNSSLLFSGETALASQAAGFNATAAHALDYDDYAFSNHPSAVLVPTILAAAELSGINGRQMLAAYCVGYEVWGDLMSREPDHLHSKGWHPTAVFGPVAAAAAASAALKLPMAQTRNALALAASFAGGVFENFGTMAKPMHGGRAAENGVNAAMLAMAGIEASPTAIEGSRGLMRALSPNGRVDLEKAPMMGKAWRIEKSRLNIKKFPTVGASQRCIDASLELRKLLPDLSRVARIEAVVSEKHDAVMPFRKPRTALEAKFSLQFAVACALHHGAVGLMQLKDEVVNAPALQALMGKVQTVLTDELDPEYPIAALNDIVHVTLDDGRVISSPKVRYASGHANAPLSTEAIWGKFVDCAAYGGIGPDKARTLFDAMQRIDALAGVKNIPRIA
jgi:2-methylcitrate dehydratase PrpD